MPYIAAKQRQRRVRNLAKQKLIKMEYKVLDIDGYIFHLEAHKGPLTLWIHTTPSAPFPELLKAIKREQVGEGEKKEVWIRDYHTKDGFKIINI